MFMSLGYIGLHMVVLLGLARFVSFKRDLFEPVLTHLILDWLRFACLGFS